MTHLGKIKDFGGTVPHEWLKINSQIGELANTWADRMDLVVSISATAGRGQAAALFDPALLQIEINTTAAFDATLPKDIGNLNERKIQFEFPKGSGAIFHEACHAKFTTWDLRAAHAALSAHENDALHLLEESRIEGLGAKANPENLAFLRACSLEIVFSDMSSEQVKSMSGMRQAAHLAGLALGRVDAGILKEIDVRDIRTAVKRVIAPSDLRKFRAIWLQFQSITRPDRDLATMYALARRWSALLDELAKDEDAAAEEADKAAAEAGQPGSGGPGDGPMGDMIREMIRALGEAVASSEISAQGDVSDQQMKEKGEADAAAKQEQKQEHDQAKAAARKVFEDGHSEPETQSNHYGGQLEYRHSKTVVARERQPTSKERQAAITVSRELEKAKYQDRVRIESNSVAPPGRLRSRGAVQAAAYRATGNRTPVELWGRVQRKHEVDPNLSVGVMVDVSGSMSDAMTPMGVSAWVMSEAVKRIQGTFAMVNYGHTVTPVVAVGKHLKAVTIYSAPDGSEAFSHGFQALNGALELLDGSGARLLVIVSDGNYKSVEIAETTKWLARCRQQGVAVLWLGYGSSTAAKRFCAASGAQFIEPGTDPSLTALAIGKAAADALTKAGSRG